MRLFVLLLCLLLPVLPALGEEVLTIREDVPEPLVITAPTRLEVHGQVHFLQGIRLEREGTLTLVLMDGCHATVTGPENWAAIANDQRPVTIACQHSQTPLHVCRESCGALICQGGADSAGIGGSAREDRRTGSGITIEGGNLTCVGGDDAAGIGGADEGDGFDIRILGGHVKATAPEVEYPLMTLPLYEYEQSALGGGEDGDTYQICLENVKAWCGPDESGAGTPLNNGRTYEKLTDVTHEIREMGSFRSQQMNPVVKEVPFTGDPASLDLILLLGLTGLAGLGRILYIARKRYS